MVGENDLIQNFTMKSGNNWGVGVLILRGDETLIGRRTGKRKLWATPGGKVEYGETVLRGVKRETKEEVNLNLKNPKLLDVEVGAFRDNDKVWVSFMFVADEFEGKEKPQLSEFSELKWVKLEDIDDYPLFEPTKMLIQRYRDSLT